MRIAVTYERESGEVFRHFGHTEFFKLYDVESGAVVHSLVIAALGSDHEELAAYLAQLRVNALICGDIGGGARKALEDVGVILFGGVAGDADTAVHAFLAGTLGYDPDAHCAHRDPCGHDCGGCGRHHFGS